MKRLIVVLALALGFPLCAGAQAQKFPTKPVRMPGDNAARSIADARVNGVRYDAATWAAIVGCAERLKVSLPEAR